MIAFTPSFSGGLAPFDQFLDLLTALVSDLFVELMAMPLLRHVSATAASFLDTDFAFDFFYCHNITKYIKFLLSIWIFAK